MGDLFTDKSTNSSQSGSSNTFSNTSKRDVPDWMLEMLKGQANGTSGGSKLQKPGVDYVTNMLNANPEVESQQYVDDTRQAYDQAIQDALAYARTRSNGVPAGRAGFAEGDALARVAAARGNNIASMRENARQFGTNSRLQGAGLLGQYANSANQNLLSIADLISGTTQSGSGSGTQSGSGMGMHTPSMFDSIMKVGGAAGGAASMFCWVAREVFGNENPRWESWRYWMVTKAPGWLFRLYNRYGERFAGWLRDKPKAKSVVRWIMNTVMERSW